MKTKTCRDEELGALAHEPKKTTRKYRGFRIPEDAPKLVRKVLKRIAKRGIAVIDTNGNGIADVLHGALSHIVTVADSKPLVLMRASNHSLVAFTSQTWDEGRVDLLEGEKA